MAQRAIGTFMEPKPERYYGYERTALVDFYLEHRPVGERALDVGCGTGLLGAELLRRGFQEAHGIEVISDAAEEAAHRLTSVANDAFPFDGAEELGAFDLIVFADSLEHMADPWMALVTAKEMLAPQGAILLSVPNVSHWSVIQQLLEGRWSYAEEGLLDRTHLRFFTPATLRETLRDVHLLIAAESSVESPLNVRPNDTLGRKVVGRIAGWCSALVGGFFLPIGPANPEPLLRRYAPQALVYQQYVIAVSDESLSS